MNTENSKKYGNDHFWAFIDEKPGKEVAIWKGPEGSEEIIARATDKYEAKQIIDALLNYVHIEDKTKLGKKEMAFLEFIASNVVEPYSTMASNAIIWNDREVYLRLLNDFPTIYV
jgi:hypothetical protein